MSYKVTVRYGAMGIVAEFATELTGLRRSDRVVVRTERGSETGVVVNGPVEADGGPPSGGEVLRVLTAQDEKELARLGAEAIPKEIAFCRGRIKELDLQMKIVAAEHLLGGEKIIFYFLAEGRVDFRQLVKDIARQYRTRIELRQIGVRDEARLLAEYGHCGQKMCCRAFMKTLEPVTMRMAKSQKATLDPTKISGVCGRLMCCLRYEDGLYRELKLLLPKKGALVTSDKATGKVVNVNVLAQTVTVQTANSNFVCVALSDILSVEGRRQGEPRKPDDSGPGASADAREAGSGSGAAGGGAAPPKTQRRPRGPRRRRRRSSAGKKGADTDKQ